MSHYDDSQGGRDFYHEPDTGMTTLEKIQYEDWRGAAAELIDGDCISDQVVSNEQMLMVGAYLPTTLRLDHADGCWYVVRERVAQ